MIDWLETRGEEVERQPTRSIERVSWQGGELTVSSDEVIEEVPAALVYNGISHVVMMVTPIDLKDFALGFSLTEGILDAPSELLDFEVVRRELGLELRLTILNLRLQRLKERRRNLAGRSGCGLCGAESLEAAIQPPATVSSSLKVDHDAIDRAARELSNFQPLQKRTGGLHAAAWCSPEGGILSAREDVGRHNALDKLIGALAVEHDRLSGFILMTSRASYEIVSKSAAANVPLLVTLSAPTALAIDLANQSGITLVGFAAPGRHVIYAGALIRAYRETEYRVFGDAPFTLSIGESSAELVRVHRRHDVDCSAFITACNPFSRALDEDTNRDRQIALVNELTDQGLVFVAGAGQHPSNSWPSEESLLVMGLDLEAAKALGVRYQQNAIVWNGPDGIAQLILLR